MAYRSQGKVNDRSLENSTMVLRLPAPCLVVLIGPSGSGKTTWAREHFAGNEVVSSDDLRARVGAGEDDQKASSAAFDLLNRIVAERARRRLTTVIDTLGLNLDDRSRWISMAHEANMPAYAVVFDTPAAVCEQRNAEKDRPVPLGVLRKQVSRFRQVLESLGSEGFDAVHRHQPAAAVPPAIASADIAESARPTRIGHSFGLLVSRFDWDEADLAATLSSIARRAEDAGFRDLWVMDHFRQIPRVGRPWEDIPEAYTTLSYLAGVTERIRLGALVTGITHRHPVVLGKMIATLDVLSGGRAMCGLGLAWDETEHEAYGIEFPDTSERYAILEDTLVMLPLLWGKGSPEFEGTTFHARELICYPRSIQDRIPILVGGSGERKTLRLVARHADACNVFGDPERVRHKVEVLHRHCEAEGRDPAEIEVTHLTNAMVAGDRRELRRRVDRARARTQSAEDYARRYRAGTVGDLVALFSAYAAAGAHHSIVAIPDVADEGSLERFAEVITRLATP
jgi:F420-dependent oxidoreductase-like protein